jgi:serine/threonine protein kinase
MTPNKCYTIIGKPQYLAPEIILSKGYRHEADWFALGVICYEILTGENPFIDTDPFLIYSKIIKGKVKYPNFLDKDAITLISGLLSTDTKKRLGCMRNNVMDIINHKWFKGFSWEDVTELKMEPIFLPDLK